MNDAEALSLKRAMLWNSLTVQIAAVIAFVVVPVFLVGQAPVELHFVHFPTLFSVGLVLTLVSGTALSVFLALLQAVRLPGLASHLSLFVLAWVVIAGFILPVCASAGMVIPEDIPTNRLNFAIVAVASTGLCVLASTGFRGFVVTLLSSIALAGGVTSAVSIRASTNTPAGNASPADRNEHFALSATKNIIVLSFDGLPGRIVSDLIKTSSRYSSTFKDFTFFENAVAQSPATDASLMGEIYGVQDYKSMGDGQVDVNRALERDHAGHLLTSVVEDSYTYGYPLNSTRRIVLDESVSELDSLNKSATLDLFSYSVVRLGTNRAVRYSHWTEHAKRIKAKLIPRPPASALAARLNDHVGPTWDRQNIADIMKYDHWVDRVGVSDKEFSVRFLHFTFTHFPVDFDASCTFKSDDSVWYDAHQNEEGIRSQVMCALDKFGEAVGKLKALGIYDRSLVVLKSDHGEPTNYFSEYPDNISINGNPLWGYSRYRPTLMIKGFAANNSAPVYRSQVVLLNDLAKTLCANSGLAIRCDQFRGVNLLSQKLESFDEPYYLYVVRKADSDFRFDTHVSVRVSSRKVPLTKAMRSSPLITLSPDPSSRFVTGSSVSRSRIR